MTNACHDNEAATSGTTTSSSSGATAVSMIATVWFRCASGGWPT